MTERQIMPVPGHVSLFEHRTLIVPEDAIFSMEVAARAQVAVCRTPYPAARCECGRYTLAWAPRP